MAGIAYDPHETDYVRTRFIPEGISARVAEFVLAGSCGFVLDLGCGNGRFLSALESSGRAIGIDISRAMIDRYRADSAGRPAWTVLADAARLPFGPATFDAVLVVSLFQLMTAAEISDCLREVDRVITPEGRVLYGYTLYEGADSVLFEDLRFALPRALASDEPLGAGRARFDEIPSIIGGVCRPIGTSVVGGWQYEIGIADLISDVAAGRFSESFGWSGAEVDAFRKLAGARVRAGGHGIDDVLVVRKKFLLQEFGSKRGENPWPSDHTSGSAAARSATWTPVGRSCD